MVGRRPEAAGIVEADEHAVAVFLFHLVPVDVGAPRVDVDAGDVEVGHVERERRGPEELPGLPVQNPDAAGLRDLDHHVAFLTARDIGIDPLDCCRIGIDARANEGSLVDVIEVPVVAGQVLVVPDELAGLDVDGDGGVAVELGGSGTWDGVDVAVALPPRPGLRI